MDLISPCSQWSTPEPDRRRFICDDTSNRVIWYSWDDNDNTKSLGGLTCRKFAD